MPIFIKILLTITVFLLIGGSGASYPKDTPFKRWCLFSLKITIPALVVMVIIAIWAI